MPKRTICIQSACKLSTSNGILRIRKEGKEPVDIPYEEIWVLILESHWCEISTASLSDLVGAGIGAIVCDNAHMPNGLLLPIAAHSRHAAIVEDQLSISKPLAKRLWQRIVKHKIANQSAVLDILKINSETVSKYISQVHSGDPDNREGVAAAAYFKLLLPEGNRREGPYTAALDYGYAVMRAGIARAAVAGGWLVSRGIHHCSDLNPFNLIDDLIEAYRPLIDLLVVANDLRSLSPQSKALLVSQFEYLVEINGQRYPASEAINVTLATLKTAVREADAEVLALPRVLSLQRVTFE